MTMSQLRSDDSSVVFNLRQLMQLEEDRVQAEQAAREAVQRERSDRDRRLRDDALRAEAERGALLARMRIEAEAAERAETERQAALLRVRLEVEAAALSERASVVRPVAESAEAPRSPTWLVAASLILVAVGMVGVGAGLTAQRAQPAVAPAVHRISSQQLQRDHARELAELREQIARINSQMPPMAAVAQRPVTVAPAKPARPKPERKDREKQHQRDATGDLADLENDTTDPIKDL